MKNDTLNRLLGEPLCNMCQAFLDDFVEANVKQRYQMGVQSVIIRQVLADCCEWCKSVAGAYDYGKEPDGIYRRHDHCRCVVTFKSEKGRYVNIHTKAESKYYRDIRIKALELANKPIDGKMIKRRKKEDNTAGIELALKRLRREMSDGIISIIGEKILSGEISIVQRKQKFLQHKSGTPQHESATNERDRKQSYLNDEISEEDAQEIIISKCGKGNPEISEGHIREYMDLDKLIGLYYNGDSWIKTKRIMIDYNAKGAHIVPVQEK
ncbi:MAG: polymorphic toxin type 50 domain-containing protein [Bacillota bacterium]|nr:polymorphic toxin type 50 domain-containing protein [Bacillota bacterium]